MRITSGVAKGIPLICPPSARPTLDRIKQAIFNMLYSIIDIENATVLDLFAGSGNMGIEALSRGAKFVTFIDKDKEACKIISQNLEKAKLGNCEVLNLNFEHFKTDKKYDIAFLDPPYNSDFLEKALNLKLAEIYVCESDKKIRFSEDYECLVAKKYGIVYISILRLKI